MYRVREELPGQGPPPNLYPSTPPPPGSSSKAHPLPCFRASLWERDLEAEREASMQPRQRTKHRCGLTWKRVGGILSNAKQQFT